MLANVITATRMAAAGAMLAFDPAEPAFWLLYAWCGASDMADGPIARKLNEESAFGARLDSVSDLAFAATCCCSLLPRCDLTLWLIALIALLAVSKTLIFVLRLGKGYDPKHVHSAENKAVGLLCSSRSPCSSSPVRASWRCLPAFYLLIRSFGNGAPFAQTRRIDPHPTLE